MLIDYLSLIILVFLSTLVGLLVLCLGLYFGAKTPTEKKGQPYESGMIPYGPGTRKMSVK